MTGKRVEVLVDTDRCSAQGQCYRVAPRLFDSDDDGYAVVREGVVALAEDEDLESAIGRCPETAISRAPDS